MKSILVRTALKAQDIQKLLEASNQDGVTFKFISKKGLDMEFLVDCDENTDAAAIAKSLIKSTDYGSALYFSVIDK